MTPCHNQHFIPNRPRFFQIIVEDTEAARESKLWIPRRFVRNYGHDMSKYVQVKDPSGREWKLECSKCDGDTWVKKGWQEFADFYSLKHGHLLVFEYEGNSQFCVSIFDNSTTEIKYPVERFHDIRDNQEIKSQETKKDETELDELVIEIADDFTPSPKKRKVNYSPGVHMTRDNSRSKPEKLSCSAKENKEVTIAEKTSQLLRNRTAKAFERAKAFKSQNPFFIIVMRPSCAQPVNGRLNVPVSFSNDHINHSEGNAILYLHGRRWDVRFYMQKKYNGTSSRATLGIGWNKFYSENHLKVHDVCVFELTNKISITFKVHIYRVDEKTGPSPSSAC